MSKAGVVGSAAVVCTVVDGSSVSSVVGVLSEDVQPNINIAERIKMITKDNCFIPLFLLFCKLVLYIFKRGNLRFRLSHV